MRPIAAYLPLSTSSRSQQVDADTAKVGMGLQGPAAVQPLLAANERGLCLFHDRLEVGEVAVHVTLVHEGDQWISQLAEEAA